MIPSIVSIVKAMKTDRLTSSFMALRHKLHRSAMAYLKDDADAEDAMLDTFVNLWRNGDVDTDLEARNKLFAVLKNVCIDRLRKPPVIGIDNINTEALIEEPFQFEDISRYESLLTVGLTDIQRRIYTLVIKDSLEYEAVAAKLNMSVEAVRMNMSRARKKIRENYKQLEK